MENQGARQIEELTDTLGNYRLDSSVQVFSMLKSVAKKGVQMSAFFRGGQDFILTDIVEVSKDAENLIFDQGADPKSNARLLAEGAATLVGFMDRIKIQFKIKNITGGRDVEGRPIFMSPLPTEVFFFQRRESFRVQVPGKYHASTTFLHPVTGEEVSARLFDISLGGLSFMMPRGVPPLLIDAQVHQASFCVLLGDEDVKLSFDLTVKNFVAHEKIIKVSCAFVGKVSALSERKLSKLITKIERENRSFRSDSKS